MLAYAPVQRCELERLLLLWLLQNVEELKSIHTLPSLLLYENGVMVHIVEGMSCLDVFVGTAEGLGIRS